MAKLFKITGIVVLVLCILGFIYMLITPGLSLIITITNLILFGIMGLALIALGDLTDRVNYLEDTLKIFQSQEENQDKIEQITCPNCGKQYDIDYPKCPYCKNETEIE